MCRLSGVYAFPCYTQHHAIVLYADVASRPAALLDPATFCARILEGDQERASTFLRVLQQGALPDKRDSLEHWGRWYMQVYGHSQQ
jgi:hypothetical protein